MKSKLYEIQNKAIHTARAELERKGVLEKGKSLEACRYLAGKINLRIQSISRLSVKQREALIGILIEMGATVRNPHIYESDLKSDAGRGGKVVGFSAPKEDQLRMVDALAARIHWRETDGYLRFCHKILGAARPRNSKEITRLRLALQSIIDQQAAISETPVENQSPSGISSVH